jgi:hypothetical protein
MELTAFAAADLNTVRWVRSTEDRHEYTLKAGDATVAVMKWEKHIGSLAHVAIVGDEWTLKRAGFLNPHLTARQSKQNVEVARMTIHSRTHLLDIRGGASYRFRRTGLLVPAWTLLDSKESKLLEIEPVRQSGRLMGALVSVEALGRTRPELPLLLAMSWYFVVLAWLEDEAASVGAAVVDAAA